MNIILCIAVSTAVVILGTIIYVLSLRKIVPTNEVHIVQRDKKTVSYGKDAKDGLGNTYYKIPTWVPKLGVMVAVLPTTIIDIDIPAYLNTNVISEVHIASEERYKEDLIDSINNYINCLNGKRCVFISVCYETNITVNII